MKIKLDLSKHCIETELKRLHNDLVSRYFKLKGECPDLEEPIEQIGNALATLDFSFLRSRFPDLAGGGGKDVFLSVDEKGEMGILIEEEKVLF